MMLTTFEVTIEGDDPAKLLFALVSWCPQWKATVSEPRRKFVARCNPNGSRVFDEICRCYFEGEKLVVVKVPFCGEYLCAIKEETFDAEFIQQGSPDLDPTQRWR